MRASIITILLALGTFFVTENQAFGAIDRAATDAKKSFQFEYKFEGSTYTYRTPATDWAEAFERGAQECFRFFKQGKTLGETRGVGLIDACANPKEKKDS